MADKDIPDLDPAPKGEFAEPQSIQQVPEHNRFDEMTNPEIRSRIARMVGANVRYDTPMSMHTLNSIHAYLTGKFYIHPSEIGSQRSCGPQQMKDAVAAAAGCTSYQPEPGSERPFNKEELVQIAKSLARSDDKRSWTG